MTGHSSPPLHLSVCTHMCMYICRVYVYILFTDLEALCKLEVLPPVFPHAYTTALFALSALDVCKCGAGTVRGGELARRSSHHLEQDQSHPITFSTGSSDVGPPGTPHCPDQLS